MITHLKIKDFAIIDELDIDFESGLSIMTGETGSGKSIIIQAISLVLGSRASISYISTGKEKAVVQMSLCDVSKSVYEKLSEYGINEEDELILTREILASGKSICRINGNIVTLGVLNSIGRRLADVHGQYDHQSLLNPENHIALIDNYYAKEILPAKEAIREVFHVYDNVCRELNTLRANKAESLRKHDFMRYELQEITAAAPFDGEDEELSQRLVLLQNSEKIFDKLNAGYEILYDSQLGQAMQLISDISEYDDKFRRFSEEISDCYYKLTDVCDEVRRARDDVVISPAETDAVIARLDALEMLKRKYGGSLGQILKYKEELENKIEKYENSETHEADLSADVKLLSEKLTILCDGLTTLRIKSGREIEKQISRELADLNFIHAVFHVHFTKNVRADGTLIFSPEGVDNAEFMFSANKGETLKPLADVASGGEASRIMLAFKRIIGDYDTIPTMIFDEIDTGISGVTASIVSKKLKQIAENHQVICITHLPQIAVAGDNHYRIEKSVKNEKTYSSIIKLDNEERVLEIARLLGGANITGTTIRNAREMLAGNGS